MTEDTSTAMAGTEVTLCLQGAYARTNPGHSQQRHQLEWDVEADRNPAFCVPTESSCRALCEGEVNQGRAGAVGKCPAIPGFWPLGYLSTDAGPQIPTTQTTPRPHHPKQLLGSSRSRRWLFYNPFLSGSSDTHREAKQ